MNTRKIVTRVIAAALVLLMCLSLLPAMTFAAEPTLTLCTGTLQAGDKVVLATADKSKGVSGYNGNKDFTVSTSSANWVQYTVAVVSGGYTLKDETANKYIKAPGGNEFKYDASSAGTFTVTSEGLLVGGSDSRNLFIYVNGSNTYYRFYANKLGTSGYTPMYVFVVGSGSGAACEHTYDDCEDTTCNKNCGHTRTAPGHVYASCVATTCENCTSGTRVAGSHEYTNEYDASCNKCSAGARTVTLPAADSTLTLAEATKVGLAQDHNKYTQNSYYVTGTVKTVGNDTYGNITIEDAAHNTFYLYTVKDVSGNNYGHFTGTKPVVGDEITVYGPIGQYSGTAQMNPAVVQPKACTQHAYTNEYDATCNNCTNGDRTVTLPAADSTLTLDVAGKLGVAQNHNTYTADKYYVEGTIKEVTSGEYGNLIIEDANGKTLVIYGSFNADGQKGYKEIENAPVAGDKIKVYGIIGQYNGKAQMKDGWITAIYVTNVTLDKTNLNLAVGSEETLTATINPGSATNKTATWTSSDPEVATVVNGKVTAKKVGTATITVTVDGKSAQCEVKVVANTKPAESVTLDKSTATLEKGQELTLNATVNPADSTDNVTWTTSDDKIATVVNGKVTTLKAGKVTITATAGSKSASCVITVTEVAAAQGAVSSLDKLTTGTYVMVTEGNAPLVLDGKWVTVANPVIANGKVTDTKKAVWTITVNGDGTVKLTDGNGKSIAPAGGKNNGIKEGDYNWKVEFVDGKFYFRGTGEDEVVLASNKSSEGKFRAYKNTTADNNAGYGTGFDLYAVEALPGGGNSGSGSTGSGSTGSGSTGSGSTGSGSTGSGSTGSGSTGSGSTGSGSTNNPKDGDAMSIVSVVSSMVLSMSGVVALVIKRKNWTV